MADISGYFPSFMGEVREFKAIAQGENPEIKEAYEAREFVLVNQFIYRAGAYGIGRLEKIIGIRPKAGDDLDERKFRVLAKINEYLPYTWNALVNMLDSLLGEDGYEAERVPNEFLVIVRVGLGSASKLEAVRELLERVVPANMGIDLTILYNRHYEVGRYRHSFLKEGISAGYTHEDIRLRKLPVFKEYQDVRINEISRLMMVTHYHIRTEFVSGWAPDKGV